ncbi:acetate kinase [Rhodanobacter sp. C01]|uniref:acetate kinase n=1 Tax=Rhodanobacter sp. C01 TaxID=1945856 RepID=UPI001115ABAD|nr:acetate kinase [Rhodanobacter sp. C01]
MEPKSWRRMCSVGCAGLVLLGGVANGQEAAAPQTPTPAGSSSQTPTDVSKKLTEQGEQLDAMRSQIEAYTAQLDAMKRKLVAQEADYRALRHAVGMDVLDRQRAGNINAAGPGASALPMPAADTVASDGQADVKPVGQAPAQDDRPPAVAPISDQPGVLTPKGKFVLEPSYQFSYSSVDRVDLIGYTVIPAILIGLIDARQVRTTTQTATLTTRYGLTNRLELEVRVPYVYAGTETTSREIFTGSAEDNVFTTSGHGIGDIEATARYQFNDGGADSTYYVGWLRFKSRTGEDPFEVVTDCVTRCVQNATGTGLPLQQPTGSGFYSLQPGLTWLLPSDPVVIFGNVSYLHNFPRYGVSRNVLLAGKEYLGKVTVGDVFDASIGVGLALNDKASISFGYDQSFVGITKQNNQTVPGSTKTVLGTFLIGGAYRLSDKRTLNFTLGVGATRDTPDVNMTVRLPTMY